MVNIQKNQPYFLLQIRRGTCRATRDSGSHVSWRNEAYRYILLAGTRFARDFNESRIVASMRRHVDSFVASIRVKTRFFSLFLFVRRRERNSDNFLCDCRENGHVLFPPVLKSKCVKPFLAACSKVGRFSKVSIFARDFRLPVKGKGKREERSSNIGDELSLAMNHLAGVQQLFFTKFSFLVELVLSCP